MPFDYEDTEVRLNNKVHEAADLWRRITDDIARFVKMHQNIGELTNQYNEEKAAHELRYHGKA